MASDQRLCTMEAWNFLPAGEREALGPTSPPASQPQRAPDDPSKDTPSVGRTATVSALQGSASI
jgi:hypothetical protein